MSLARDVLKQWFLLDTHYFNKEGGFDMAHTVNVVINAAMKEMKKVEDLEQQIRESKTKLNKLMQDMTPEEYQKFVNGSGYVPI